MMRSTTLLVATLLCSAAAAQSRTFTTDADFAEGTGSNVTIGDGQMCVSGSSTEGRHLFIANHRCGTVSKIDPANGREVARYSAGLPTNWDGTATGARPLFEQCNWGNSGNCPSRTTVDLNGDAWVANRAFGFRSTVTKYAGSLSHCVDRNGNGVIDTSTDVDGNGRINVDESAVGGGFVETTLVQGHVGGTCNVTFDPAEFKGNSDECILCTVAVGGVNDLARGLQVGLDGKIWVGMYNGRNVHRIDPDTCRVELSSPNLGSAVYGLTVDADGFIYNAPNDHTRTVRRIHPTTGAVVGSLVVPNHNYGIAASGPGRVVLSSTDGCGGVQFANFAGNSVTDGPCLNVGFTGPVAVASDGTIWATAAFRSTSGRLLKLSSSGVLLAEIPVGSQPHGVALDNDGNVWTSNFGNRTATRVNPATNTATATSARLGLQPYTYGDFIGTGVRSFVLPGTWTMFHDGGIPGTPWLRIEYQASAPSGTSLTVAVRAHDDPLQIGAVPFTTAAPGAPLSGVIGQYLEIRVSMSSSAGQPPCLEELTAVAPVPPCEEKFVEYSGYRFEWDDEDEDGMPEAVRCEGDHVDVVADSVADLCGVLLVFGTRGDDGVDLERIGAGPMIAWLGAGDDYAEGSDGDDVIYGGPGRDNINGEAGDDFLCGNTGDDDLDGEAGDDHLGGGEGDDRLLGKEGHDRIEGNGGDDRCIGHQGDDVIDSGHGNDFVLAGNGDDVLQCGPGDDFCKGSEGHDTIDDYSGTDYCSGGGGDDVIDCKGGDGDPDVVVGRGGNDVLRSCPGHDDLLLGGAGADECTTDHAATSRCTRVGC